MKKKPPKAHEKKPVSPAAQEKKPGPRIANPQEVSWAIFHYIKST